MAWSRGVLRGFTGVAKRAGWNLLHYHTPADLRWLVEIWKPAAVVLQLWHYRINKTVLGHERVVCVNDDASEDGIPSVCLDNLAIGELAAKHLVDRGFRDVTAFRFNDGPFARQRERGFLDAACERSARIAPVWWVDGADPPPFAEDPTAITGWLAKLPRPCGIFACTDSWARVVARYACAAGMRIPEDLALIGVDNDTVDCELAAPPLSSVAVPWLTVGECTASLVARVLSGKGNGPERIVIPPADVIPRRSTDHAAVDDALVARAMAYIVEHASRRLTLEMIARATACSRQLLEQRFRAAIGRSVMQEVRRARIDAAKRLLSTTDSSLPSIAAECGFTNAALLSVAFKAATGVPPGAYRRQLQGVHAAEE